MNLVIAQTYCSCRRGTSNCRTQASCKTVTDDDSEHPQMKALCVCMTAHLMGKSNCRGLPTTLTSLAASSPPTGACTRHLKDVHATTGQGAGIGLNLACASQHGTRKPYNLDMLVTKAGAAYPIRHGIAEETTVACARMDPYCAFLAPHSFEACRNLILDS